MQERYRDVAGGVLRIAFVSQEEGTLKGSRFYSEAIPVSNAELQEEDKIILQNATNRAIQSSSQSRKLS